MKTLLKQASFWENRHVEPFYRSPLVSDEEEHKIDAIYANAIPRIGQIVGASAGAIAGGLKAHHVGGDVLKGAGVGAATGILVVGGAADVGGQYLRNKKIIKKRRDNNQPIYGDYEKAHYAAAKPAPSLPIRDVKIKTQWQK